jgi:hypothetical protein
MFPQPEDILMTRLSSPSPMLFAPALITFLFGCASSAGAGQTGGPTSTVATHTAEPPPTSPPSASSSIPIARVSASAFTTPSSAPPAPPDQPFTLSGYVVEVHSCPPCPPRAMCKPCDGYVVVSTEQHPKDTRFDAPGNSRVDVNDPSKFSVGMAVAQMKVLATSRPSEVRQVE